MNEISSKYQGDSATFMGAPRSFMQGYIYGLHSGAGADVGAASLDRLRERAAGSYGLIIDADSALCLMCEDRDLALVRDSSLSTTAQLAFGYRKDFPLKGRMDGLILRYFADGTMGRFRKRWFKYCEPNSQPATARTARQPTAFGKDRTRTHSIFPAVSSAASFVLQTAPSSTCCSPESPPPSSPSWSSCTT